MSDNSAIEWTEATLNVVTGCTRISEGCDHCYIERTMPFRVARRRFDKPGVGGTTGLVFHEDRLRLPLGWRKPRRIFVNSLADLWHDEVPVEFIARVFALMASSPQHTYQLLTKRHARLRSVLADPSFEDAVDTAMGEFTHSSLDQWPLPNAWIGVSVESQKWADLRVPALLATPAAVRWLSLEPLLGPVDLHFCGGVDALERDWAGGPGGGTGTPHPFIDWAVIGGESGPAARPMDLSWASSLVKQCQGADVPVFVKQLGSPAGRDHHDIATFPERLRVRQYPTPAPAVAS